MMSIVTLRESEALAGLGTTNYLYDGPNSVEEVDNSGNFLAKYARTAKVDEPLSEFRAGTTSYYEQDGLRSVTSLSNSSSALANTYTYDSFGKLTASTGTLANPFQFTGREFDPESGAYEYRARYYDTSAGRFVSEDPIGFKGGINKYPYVLNNPTMFNDPTGLDTVVIIVWDNPINHSGVYVDNGGKQNDNGPVIYDPGGDFSTSHSCGSGDLCEGYTVDDYVKHYERQGDKVDVLRFPTTPEEEARIGDRMAEHGGTPGTCALNVRRVLNNIGPFENLGHPITPGGLRDVLMQIEDSPEVALRYLLRRVIPRGPFLGWD